MDVALIIAVVLTALTLAVWLFSFLMGFFRDGAAKAFWKFTWAGLAALAAFGVAMLMRGTFADAMHAAVVDGTLFEGDTPTVIVQMADVIASVMGAIAAPFLFCVIYLPIRWLFLIPQVLLWKHLVSPNLDKLIKKETGEFKFGRAWEALWNVGGGVFRVLATIILTSAIFLGITGYTVAVADAGKPFVDAYSDTLDEDALMVLDTAYAFSDHFAVRTGAFTYGGLFRAMTSIDMGEIDTNIPEMIETTSTAGYQVCALLLPSDGHELTPHELAAAADETFKELCETDFFPSLLAYGMNAAAEMDEVKEGLLSSEDENVREIGEILIQLMKDATTESVRADLLTLSDLVREMSDCGILEYMLSGEEDAEPPLDKIMDEERLSRLMMVAYDNSFGRALFTPVVNMLLNAGLDALGAESVTLNSDIQNMSREQMHEESRRLAKAIVKLGEVVESMEGENVGIADVNIGALGEAFDLIKESTLLGDTYEEVLDSVGKSETVSGALGETGGTIIGAIKDAPSVEDALVISQSFAVISEQLTNVAEGGEAGADKEALAGALQSLVSSSNEENNEFILGKVDELFPAGEGGEEVEMAKESVKEIATALLDAVSDLEEITDEQAAVEADSLLGLYDMVSGNTEVADNKEAAEEIIGNIAASTVLMKTVENAVESGNDFGVKENLPPEIVDKVAEVIESAEITDEQRATLLAFFGK